MLMIKNLTKQQFPKHSQQSRTSSHNQNTQII